MVNIPAAIRTHLLTKPAITALTGTRIYANRDVPPTGYTPDQGAAICFASRGGSVNDESSTHLRESYQFKCYGLDEVAAHSLSLALYDALHEARFWPVRQSMAEALPQPLEEPETQWRYSLSFYSFFFANP